MKALIKVIIFFTMIVLLSGGIFMKSKSENSIYYVNGQEGQEEEVEQEEEEGNIKKDDIMDKEEKESEIEEIRGEEIKKDNEIEYININPEEVYIPILMYHSISDSDSGNNLLVPVNQFTEQMNWLKEEGFETMLMGDVIKSLKSGEVPRRPVAITFDDGYADNYVDAYKILNDKNMKATFFIITDNTDADSGYMNSDMLKEMISNGMGIENHTSKHLELDKLSRDDKEDIINEGKDFFKETLGLDSKYLSYPVGRYDDETIQIARELGLEGAVTTASGLANIANSEFELKRIRIGPMEIENFKSIFEDFMIEN